MPPERRFLKATSGVCFTSPSRDTKTSAVSAGSSSPMLTTAAIGSSSTGTRLTIGLPRAARPASGTSCTGSGKTLPVAVKTSRVSCVFAMNRLVTKSSSRVAMACLPAPPRRCIRHSDGLQRLM